MKAWIKRSEFLLGTEIALLTFKADEDGIKPLKYITAYWLDFSYHLAKVLQLNTQQIFVLLCGMDAISMECAQHHQCKIK